jgi:hypothetical protein
MPIRVVGTLEASSLMLNMLVGVANKLMGVVIKVWSGVV